MSPRGDQRRYSIGKGVGARLVIAVDGGDVAPRKPAFPYGTMLKIACPDCKSPVDEKCRDGKGNVKAAVHVARRRMAIRKYYADQEQA